MSSFTSDQPLLMAPWYSVKEADFDITIGLRMAAAPDPHWSPGKVLTCVGVLVIRGSSVQRPSLIHIIVIEPCFLMESRQHLTSPGLELELALERQAATDREIKPSAQGGCDTAFQIPPALL